MLQVVVKRFALNRKQGIISFCTIPIFSSANEMLNLTRPFLTPVILCGIFIALTAFSAHGKTLGILGDRDPAVLYSVNTDQPIIALTIDDGPDPLIVPSFTSQTLCSLPTFSHPANVLPSNSEAHSASSPKIAERGNRTNMVARQSRYREIEVYISELLGLRLTDCWTGDEPVLVCPVNLNRKWLAPKDPQGGFSQWNRGCTHAKPRQPHW